MKKIVEYKLAMESNEIKLMDEINCLIKENWQPFNNPFVLEAEQLYVCQVVVKYEE
jgi:hypothetical protein